MWRFFSGGAIALALLFVLIGASSASAAEDTKYYVSDYLPSFVTELDGTWEPQGGGPRTNRPAPSADPSSECQSDPNFAALVTRDDYAAQWTTTTTALIGDSYFEVDLRMLLQVSHLADAEENRRLAEWFGPWAESCYPELHARNGFAVEGGHQSYPADSFAGSIYEMSRRDPSNETNRLFRGLHAEGNLLFGISIFTAPSTDRWLTPELAADLELGDHHREVLAAIEERVSKMSPAVEVLGLAPEMESATSVPSPEPEPEPEPEPDSARELVASPAPSALQPVAVLVDGHTLRAHGLVDGRTWVLAETDSVVREVSVSPGGHTVAYFRSDGNSGGRVQIVAIDGSVDRPLSAHESFSGFGWTSTGDTVILDRPVGETSREIVAVPLNGDSDETEVVSATETLRLLGARGGVIAYSVLTDPEAEAYDTVFVGEDGGELHRVSLSEEPKEVAFNGDGSKAILGSAKQLHLVEPFEQASKLVVHGGGSVSGLAISDSGDLVAYAEWDALGQDNWPDVIVQDPFDPASRVRIGADNTFGASDPAFGSGDDEFAVAFRHSSGRAASLVATDGTGRKALGEGAPVAFGYAESIEAGLSDGPDEEIPAVAEPPIDPELEALIEEYQSLREQSNSFDQNTIYLNVPRSTGYQPREESILDSRGGRRLVFGVPLMIIAWIVRATREDESSYRP